MRCKREEICFECPRFIRKDDFITQCLKDCIHPQEIRNEQRMEILNEQNVKIGLERRNLELEERKRVQLWEDAQHKKAEDRAIASEQCKSSTTKKVGDKNEKGGGKLKKISQRTRKVTE